MFSFATSMTPGPNNIMLLSSGLTFGYKRTAMTQFHLKDNELDAISNYILSYKGKK